jgi:hypothetical protein
VEGHPVKSDGYPLHTTSAQEMMTEQWQDAETLYVLNVQAWKSVDAGRTFNVLYATGNIVFRTTNEGTSWEPISPDLTRNDVTKLGPSGGPITRDTTGAEHYATIFAFVESPHEPGVFWAGSDDGLIHLSRDGGKTWASVTPAGLPEWTVISMIEPSPHAPATAYVAATRYKLDDFQPYLYKTNDYGRTWTTITSGIPDHDFTRVIREDPGRRGLLYAGTETGI